MNQELVLQHVSFADSIATRHFRKTPPQIQLEELKSAAYMGLVDAANRYDGYRDFKSFAAPRIMGEIKDYLRSLRWTKVCKVTPLEVDVCSPMETDLDDDFQYRVRNRVSPLAESILKMRFCEEMTLTEIATRIKLSAARVSQLIKENLSLLRECA